MTPRDKWPGVWTFLCQRPEARRLPWQVPAPAPSLESHPQSHPGGMGEGWGRGPLGKQLSGQPCRGMSFLCLQGLAPGPGQGNTLAACGMSEWAHGWAVTQETVVLC